MRFSTTASCACLLAASLLTACAGAPQDAPARKRNVVLMMADDLASNDLSCYGGRHIETPNIDRFAADALRLTNYYAGSAVCTPSRMALLSGSYPARLGWRNGVLGYGFAPKTGMSQDIHTIAEAFRDAGYRTAMAGKWHLGAEDLAPAQQGFDSSLFLHMSNNQNRDLYRGTELVQKGFDNRRLSEAFADEAVRVIEAAGDEPFFLYVPWTAPHFPAEPHPKWKDRSGTDRPARYKDVVEELDARVGEVLAALERSGKAEDTIVIFTSDNGRQQGQQQKQPDPLYRGRKWQSLEGGTRVPCIVRCPGVIEPGVRDALVASIDLYPTLAAACGVGLAAPRGAQQIDGIDLWPALTGRAEAEREELLYWHGKGAATAIRVGTWKLRFHRTEDQPADPPLPNGFELFDLATDEREARNVAASHPEVVARLAARARQLLQDVYGAQVPLGTWPGAEPLPDPLRARDVWGPWLDAAGR